MNTDEPDSKDYSNHSSSNYERKKNLQNSNRKPYMGSGGGNCSSGGGGGGTYRGGNPNVGLNSHHSNSNAVSMNNNASVPPPNQNIRKGPLIHHPISESSGNSHIYSSGAGHHHTERNTPPPVYNQRVNSTQNSKCDNTTHTHTHTHFSVNFRSCLPAHAFQIVSHLNAQVHPHHKWIIPKSGQSTTISPWLRHCQRSAMYTITLIEPERLAQNRWTYVEMLAIEILPVPTRPSRIIRRTVSFQVINNIIHKITISSNNNSRKFKLARRMSVVSMVGCCLSFILPMFERILINQCEFPQYDCGPCRYGKRISNESNGHSTEYWTQSGQSTNTKRSNYTIYHCQSYTFS